MMQNTIVLSYDNIKRYNNRKEFEYSVLQFYNRVKTHQNIILHEDGGFFYNNRFIWIISI